MNLLSHPFHAATLLSLVAASLSTNSSAQITQIPFFTGSVSRGFEAVSTDRSPCFPPTWVSICTGSGADGNSSTGFVIGPRCDLQPYSGQRFGLTLDRIASAETTVLEFPTPVFRFGLHLAHIEDTDITWSVRAFDLGGNELSNIALTLPSCGWEWFGLQSAGPAIARVEISGQPDSIYCLAYDDLQSDVSIGIGMPYCAPAVPNSTGLPAAIYALGSPVVSNNDLTLVASDLPPFAFGVFIVSRMQGFVQNPGGSSGVLCVGGNVGRYTGPGQIQNSGSAGQISIATDLLSIPGPTGSVTATAGETWNFQAWYRDANPVATSNFTSGVSVFLL